MDLDYLYENQDVLLHNKTPDELLRRARELIKERRHYATEDMAVAEHEGGVEAVKPLDPRATRWNVEGALAKVSNPWGIIPSGILRYLDSYVFEYIHNQPELQRQVRPEQFGSFGDFCRWASHEHALQFLEGARQLIVETRYGRIG